MSRKTSSHIKIAIDGPGGAGKSSVALELASRMKLYYLDTGAMYRAVTLKLIREKVPLEDTAAIEAVLDRTLIAPAQNGICLDGENVSGEIRKPYVNEMVSKVSAITAVRRKMVKLQQRVARDAGGIVMDGRDIATRVMPGADFKFYLDADLQERARRRRQEQLQRGIELTLEQVAEEIRERDLIDSQRTDSPLCVAAGSIVVDTTKMTFQEVVEHLMEIIESSDDRCN